MTFKTFILFPPYRLPVMNMASYPVSLVGFSLQSNIDRMFASQPSGRFADDPEVVRSNGPEVYSPSETIPTCSTSNYTEKTPQPVHQGRTICGLRRATFLLALALVAVIVLAAALGGGIGSTVCHRNSNKSISHVLIATP